MWDWGSVNPSSNATFQLNYGGGRQQKSKHRLSGSSKAEEALTPS